MDNPQHRKACVFHLTVDNNGRLKQKTAGRLLGTAIPPPAKEEGVLYPSTVIGTRSMKTSIRPFLTTLALTLPLAGAKAQTCTTNNRTLRPSLSVQWRQPVGFHPGQPCVLAALGLRELRELALDVRDLLWRSPRVRRGIVFAVAEEFEGCEALGGQPGGRVAT